MNEQVRQQPGNDRSGRFHVLIAGGGVGGLEAALALHELARERVAITLLTPEDEFVYRPLSIGEPFNRSYAGRYPIAELAGQVGAELIRDSLAEVDHARRIARTAGGLELSYSGLLVATGATLHPIFEHATAVDDARMDELLHGLVQDLELGYVRRLGVVLPAPMPWPLPGYELALMASERAWDMQVELDVTLLTQERMPLEAFGEAASRALSALLGERRIEVVPSARCEIPRSKTVIVHPGGRTIELDRVVAFPALRGPFVEGLPHDQDGFLPVDESCRVRGTERVWAAGDAADFPVKQGGIAAQMGDVAAGCIAALCGAHLAAPTFVPVLEGVLMTGGSPRYLRARPASPGSMGESVFTELPPSSSLPKISARHLDRYLATRTEPVRGAGH